MAFSTSNKVQFFIQSRKFIFFYFIFNVFTGWCLNVSLGLNSLNWVITYHWQFLDIPTLILDPLNSILYQHTQPPLLNLIIILLSNLNGSLYDNFVILNSLLVGCIAVIIFKILYDSTKNIILSLIISFSFLIFPTTMLNTSYPFYTCLTAFGYALLIYSFHLNSLNFSRSIVYFVISCILLSLTRSSFTILHQVFFIVIFFLYNLSFKTYSKKIFIIPILIILPSLIVPLKNYILYDFFGSSSWAPLNIAKGVGIEVKTHDKNYSFFPTPKMINEIYPKLQCKHSYHPQDTMYEKFNGRANYNSCLVLEYSRIIKNQNLKEYKLKKHMKNFLVNTTKYFSPSDNYKMLKNRDSIEHYANIVKYLQLTIPIYKSHYEIRLILLIIIFLSLICSILFKDKFLLFCLILIFSHYFTHVVTDGMESKRFVFDIEFIFFILFGLIYSKYEEFLKFKHIKTQKTKFK